MLRRVSWRGYLTLLDEIGDDAVRLTYDNGRLEIEVPTELHEKLKKVVAGMAEAALDADGVDYEALGSTTWRREERLRGIEADDCYYIGSLPAIRDKDRVDLAVDPPPDLAIEAEVTSPAVPKLPIYAALGVGEVWRVLETGEVRIARLSASGEYQPVPRSVVIPRLDADLLTAFVRSFRPLGTAVYSEVLRRFRAWLGGGVEAPGGGGTR